MPQTGRFGIVAAGLATSRPLMLTAIDNLMTVYRSLDDAFSGRDVVVAGGEVEGESSI